MITRPSCVCEGMEITVKAGAIPRRLKVAPEPQGFDHIECDAWVYYPDNAFKRRVPVVLLKGGWRFAHYDKPYTIAVETVKLKD